MAEAGHVVLCHELGKFGGIGFVWRRITSGLDVSVPSLLGSAFRVDINHVPG